MCYQPLPIYMDVKCLTKSIKVGKHLLYLMSSHIKFIKKNAIKITIRHLENV